MLRARRVLESCLYVDDLKAAEDFYTRVLGLQVYARVEPRHVFFRCGQGMFLLFNPAETEKSTGQVPTHGARGPGHVALAIEAGDIAAWCEQLTRSGVAIETQIAWPTGGHSIYFRDPAGNSIELATPQVWPSP